MLVETDNYKDNPQLLEEKIANLSLTEQAAFDFGFVVALLSVLEDIQDAKNRCLSKAVVIEKENSKLELLSRVHIMDVFDKFYSKRVKLLMAELESSFLPL